MKIYYSPAFTSNAYFDMKNKEVAFDTQICGNAELLRTLMLHLGIHHELISSVERQAEYYNAFAECNEADKENVFKESFDAGGLSVSSKCLEWRDELILAGWTANMEQQSDRLKFLAKVEKSFNCIGESDCWVEVLNTMGSVCALPKGSEIIVADIQRKYLPPYINKALEKLEKFGIKVSVLQTNTPLAQDNLGIIQNYLMAGEAKKLGANDKSLEILNFTDSMSALQYVASLKPDDYDLYINSDNKTFDDIQLSLNYPTSGASLSNANPQIVQLFKIGLSLFDYPINIYNVLSWLLMPMNPIHSPLRRKLAKAISKSGGIKNEEWDKAIDEYLSNDIYDYKDDTRVLRTDEDKKADIEKLAYLIPLLRSTEIHIEELKKFVGSISDYARKMSHANDNKHILSDFSIEQFERLTAMLNALGRILEKYAPTTLPYLQLEQWMNAIYESASYKYTDMQSDSRYVVSSPGDIATPVDRILWMDFYNYSVPKYTFDFLNEAEKTSLTQQGCMITDSINETYLANSFYKIPFYNCKSKLTLITVERKGGELTTKHPLLIRLEESFKKSLKSVTSTGALADNDYVDKKLFDNSSDGLSITINNKELVKFKGTESATSLENLLQYPFDYTMKYLAGFKEGMTNQLPEMMTTKGNVAHAVVEYLCKKNNKDLILIQQDFCDHFETILEEMIMEKGAILQLAENKTDKMLFTLKLKESIGILLKIIKENGLTICDNEHEVTEKLGLYQDIDTEGKMDMLLTDSKGSLILFDFKWSESSKYDKKLRENTSLQLSLYEQLLAKESGKEVVAKAYYLFPQHELLTTSASIRGQHVHLINAQNNENLLAKIKSSYEYRRKQIEEQGFIELAEDSPAEDVQYYKDQTENNLFPLETFKKDNITKKGTNFYSQYTLLKGNLK